MMLGPLPPLSFALKKKKNDTIIVLYGLSRVFPALTGFGVTFTSSWTLLIFLKHRADLHLCLKFLTSQRKCFIYLVYGNVFEC